MKEPYQTIVRFILTLMVIGLSYTETGPATAWALFLIYIGIETLVYQVRDISCAVRCLNEKD